SGSCKGKVSRDSWRNKMAQINIFITKKKGFFFLILILVQVLSVQVLSLKHGKSLFRWGGAGAPSHLPLTH
ncbi:MAG: hypothetical protein ACK55Z_19850, partial [bacterium]